MRLQDSIEFRRDGKSRFIFMTAELRKRSRLRNKKGFEVPKKRRGDKCDAMRGIN